MSVDSKMRNQPCPCGSGKKYKKCCIGKKKRIKSYKVDLGKPMWVKGVQMLPDGTFRFLTDQGVAVPEHVSVETCYEREKGNKVLNRTNVTNFKHYLNPGQGLLIQTIGRSVESVSDLFIGLIIDFDLGSLDAYNARLSPLIDDYYLPEGFELMYASAEVGMENVQNKLISCADKLSTWMLRRVVNNFDDETDLKVVSEDMTHFRFWLHYPDK